MENMKFCEIFCTPLNVSVISQSRFLSLFLILAPKIEPFPFWISLLSGIVAITDIMHGKKTILHIVLAYRLCSTLYKVKCYNCFYFEVNLKMLLKTLNIRYLEATEIWHMMQKHRLAPFWKFKSFNGWKKHVNGYFWSYNFSFIIGSHNFPKFSKIENLF